MGIEGAAVALLLGAQLSAGAIVARVKENDLKIHDLQAAVHMEIRDEGETKSRVFDLLMKRDGVDYDALIVLQEPAAMAGTKFLIHAKRGERNKQWAYFPDLGLTREIAGQRQDDPFLGSDITYADLAGGAHLDDLLHTLVGEDVVDGAPTYVLEGVPRHDIVYSKLKGWVRKDDFVNVKAAFYGDGGALLKEAFLSDVRDVGGGALLAHHIEVRSAASKRSTTLTFSNVVVNQGLSDDRFTEDNLAKE